MSVLCQAAAEAKMSRDALVTATVQWALDAKLAFRNAPSTLLEAASSKNYMGYLSTPKT